MTGRPPTMITHHPAQGGNSEADFGKQVLDLAKRYGWKVFKQRWNPRGRPGVPGWPDLVMLRRGRLVVLELKKEKGGIVSPEQDAWLAAWAQLAWAANDRVENVVIVAIVKPSDLPQIVKWLA